MATNFCTYAKSDMTPCVRKDGATAFCFGLYDQPICVGCERSPEQLGVPRPADWEKTIADYYKKHPRR